MRDCAAEARPADETAEAEQGQRSVFASGLRPAQQKQGTATKGAERSEAKGACPDCTAYNTKTAPGRGRLGVLGLWFALYLWLGTMTSRPPM